MANAASQPFVLSKPPTPPVVFAEMPTQPVAVKVVFEKNESGQWECLFQLPAGEVLTARDINILSRTFEVELSKFKRIQSRRLALQRANQQEIA
jgi:hypothetical protein